MISIRETRGIWISRNGAWEANKIVPGRQSGENSFTCLHRAEKLGRCNGAQGKEEVQELCPWGLSQGALYRFSTCVLAM